MRATPEVAAGQPLRTCVGCGEADGAAELVRVVLAEDAVESPIVVDLAGKAFGRGAWLHPRAECVTGAAKRGLARSFKTAVRISPELLTAALGAAAERRLLSLLGSALRSRLLVAGSDAVKDAWAEGGVELVLLAGDAAAARKLPVVEQAARSARLCEWGTKNMLGAALGRPDTALVAVLDARLASAVRTALSVAGLVTPSSTASSGGEQKIVDESTEDR